MVRVKTGTVTRWWVLDEVNQEENEPDEVDGMIRKLLLEVMQCISKRAVGNL